MDGSHVSLSYFQIRQRFHALFVSLELLKKLNNVNEQNGQIIPYNSFYISELKDKVDIKSDYLSWVQQQSPARYNVAHQVSERKSNTIFIWL